MNAIAIIFALLIGWSGFRLITKSEKNRKKAEHWRGYDRAKYDDNYFSYVIQFFVGMCMICACILWLAYLNA